MTTNNEQRTTNKIIWLFFAFLIVAVYFFGLTIPLVGPDEPRYAEIGREMFGRGDWITPTLGGATWFEKPALLYWLEIVSYHIFGISEFAARFGSAVFGLGTVAALWILGKFYSPQSTVHSPQSTVHSPKSEDFANWLATVAATSIGMLIFSRAASFDIILTFPITASLAGFFIFDQDKDKSFSIFRFPFSISLLAFYFFIGLALIAKGLLGIVFPFGIVGFYYVLSWKLPPKTFLFSLIWGTILSVIVALIWYLPVYQANGWKFFDEFIIQHHFQRYVSNKYSHPQPFWFFWLVLPLMTLPWLPFFIAAILDIFRSPKSEVRNPKSKVQSPKSKVQSQQSKIENRKPKTENRKNFILFSSSPLLLFSSSPLLLFSLSWLLVPLVFFTFSGSKLPGYILPALPAACVLTGEFVARLAEKSHLWKNVFRLTALATLILTIILLEFVAPPFAADDSTKPLIAAANSAGFSDAEVLNLHTVAHNAEFYAAGRLIRNADGTLRKFLGVEEVAEEIRRKNGAAVLILVPPEYFDQLENSDFVAAQKLAQTSELIIAVARLK